MARLLSGHMANNPMQASMAEGRFLAESGKDQNMFMGDGHLNVPGERKSEGDLTEAKRRLAKRANEIYRSLCNELELGQCFFSGFGAWSEFIEGKINETSFYEKAKEEAHIIAGKVDKVMG